MKKLGLYVHIPFCERKCNYCDFYSLAKSDDLEKSYVNALLKEIESYKSMCMDYQVDTIFIGGGTPSYLKSSNIGLILEQIRHNYRVDYNVEITIEANPNSITYEKIYNYKSYGVNRISIGIQSLDEKVLKLIGRLHSAEEALKAIDVVKTAGITNINTDVMFNIPGQSVESVIDTLRQLIAKNVEHISFYSLKLEEGTPLYKMEEKGIITMIDDEKERAIYYASREYMIENGYKQYEISNFAREGFECKHNEKYWMGGAYLGFGPFSHSLFNNKRYCNISDIKLYIDNIDNPSVYRQLDEVLDEKDLIFEFIMLRLRMNRGIVIDDFKKSFGRDIFDLYKKQIDKLVNEKLLIIDDKSIRLTKRGIDVSNYVFEEFMD